MWDPGKNDILEFYGVPLVSGCNDLPQKEPGQNNLAKFKPSDSKRSSCFAKALAASLAVCTLLIGNESNARDQVDNKFLVSRASERVTSPPPFPILGKPIDLRKSIYSKFIPAIEKYPDLERCLAKGEQNDPARLDLSRFPWAEFRSPEAMRVCVFYAGHALGDVYRTQEWLESQEFEIWTRPENHPPPFVPNDDGERANNHVLDAGNKNATHKPQPEILRMIYNMWFLDWDRWEFAERQGGVRLEYASPDRIVSVTLN